MEHHFSLRHFFHHFFTLSSQGEQWWNKTTLCEWRIRANINLIGKPENHSTTCSVFWLNERIPIY